MNHIKAKELTDKIKNMLDKHKVIGLTPKELDKLHKMVRKGDKFYKTNHFVANKS